MIYRFIPYVNKKNQNATCPVLHCTQSNRGFLIQSGAFRNSLGKKENKPSGPVKIVIQTMEHMGIIRAAGMKMRLSIY